MLASAQWCQVAPAQMCPYGYVANLIEYFFTSRCELAVGIGLEEDFARGYVVVWPYEPAAAVAPIVFKVECFVALGGFGELG